MTCLHQSDLSSLLQHFNHVPAEDSFPICASAELTTSCNYSCPHCYLPRNAPDASKTLLTADQWIRILSILQKNGVLFLLLTGGEPLLHPHFREIYENAIKRGFLVTLFTNGSHLDAEYVDYFAKYRPKRIEICLYSLSANAHNQFSGYPNAYEQAQSAICALKSRNVPLSIKTMVTKHNLDELSAIIQWCASEEIPFRYDAMINPRINGDDTPLEHRITPCQYAELASHALENPEQWLAKIQNTINLPPDTPLLRCGAGTMSAHIDSAGWMHPCTIWRNDPFDLLERSARSWPQHLEHIKRIKIPSASACNTCRYLPICQTCPAFSQLETGTAGMPVDYLCDICREQEKYLLQQQDAVL